MLMPSTWSMMIHTKAALKMINSNYWSSMANTILVKIDVFNAIAKWLVDYDNSMELISGGRPRSTNEHLKKLSSLVLCRHILPHIYTIERLGPARGRVLGLPSPSHTTFAHESRAEITPSNSAHNPQVGLFIV